MENGTEMRNQDGQRARETDGDRQLEERHTDWDGETEIGRNKDVEIETEV